MKFHILPLICFLGMQTLVGQDEQKPSVITGDALSNLRLTGEWKEQPAEMHRMPGDSTMGLQGILVPYEIWFDPSSWKVSDSLNDRAEKSFRNVEKGISAIVTARKEYFSLAEVNDLIIKNSRDSELQNASIISESKRIVNGTELLFIHWKAQYHGTETDFLSYVFSGKSGTVMVHTYTTSASFEKNHQAMENFLNGLVLPGGHF